MQRALRGHKIKTVAPKASTVPIEPSNYLEHRGEKRKEFDAKTKEANELAELERQKQLEEQAKIEEEHTRVLRKTTLIHKPEPITKYKDAPAKKIIPVTEVSFYAIFRIAFEEYVG